MKGNNVIQMYERKLCHANVWAYTQEVFFEMTHLQMKEFQREEQMTKLAKPSGLGSKLRD